MAHEDRWYMTLSAHIVAWAARVLLYRSDNLTDWQYLHPLFVGDRARNGYNFECANFFPLGDKWVMIISVHDGGMRHLYALLRGALGKRALHPRKREAFTTPAYSYASLMHVDDQRASADLGSWLREGAQRRPAEGGRLERRAGHSARTQPGQREPARSARLCPNGRRCAGNISISRPGRWARRGRRSAGWRWISKPSSTPGRRPKLAGSSCRARPMDKLAVAITMSSTQTLRCGGNTTRRTPRSTARPQGMAHRAGCRARRCSCASCWMARCLKSSPTGARGSPAASIRERRGAVSAS